MAVIFTAEQAAQITSALVDKINAADTKATNAATAAAAADTKATNAASAAATADTKATNAASAAAAADTKATNAASAAAAADTKATNAASAAAAAQTTANSKQHQLYKHIVHLGADGENYASDVIIEVIDASNANLTTGQIVAHLNARDCSIQLKPSTNSIPLNYTQDFTIVGDSLSSQVALLYTGGDYDLDSFGFAISNITQTTTAL